jgi:hypothetical protein
MMTVIFPLFIDIAGESKMWKIARYSGIDIMIVIYTYPLDIAEICFGVAEI